MTQVKDMDLTPDYVTGLLEQHRWAATGVSDYPPRDPLVGQSRFFRRYKTFIRTVDQGQDRFAHVFAVEGEWGRGKSRLGYELIAQINDCSRGWYVRDVTGRLTDASLFDSAQRRDEYLGLYIRYSQLASDYQSSDNWFSFGLYKALLPLATKAFDGSIQSRIAAQTLRRLEPEGFEPARLAELLQVEARHSDEALYCDPVLATTLVQSAYAYLGQFGIRYVLIVLDELETVAEAATFGLEADQENHLDGQAIRLIGKAIKEEDPRAKLPWLRYVALCSPLLGQQLREIKSVERRFELAELESNAFADVSDYVIQLKSAKRLAFDYPTGLVEAAYAMSGANFGWFNVVMANVDAVLGQFVAAVREIPETGEVIAAVLDSSGRVASHVLDHNAIEGIDTRDQALLSLARRLLFGQLPIALTGCPPRMPELLEHRNEYSEPIASRYRRVLWDRIDCRRALEEAKFQRDEDEWLYPGVEQGLNLDALLANLRTFAIVEPDPGALLIPLALVEFKHLVGLIYNHPAAEFAADALWQKLVGAQRELPPEEATHIGPSVAMLLRLDLRYRRQQHNSMIFRDPGLADAHAGAMRDFESACRTDRALRARTRLTGLFRLLDRNWHYAEPAFPNREGLTIQQAQRGRGRGGKGGLLFCDGLKLHPDGQVWFAWVGSNAELVSLHALVRRIGAESGRLPVMAFTGSLGVLEYYEKGGFDDPSTRGKSDILLYYLNSSELDVMERIGLLPEQAAGLEIKDETFTSRFKARLNAIREFAYQAIHRWRRELDRRGLIAWPLRPGGKLNSEDRALLFKAWKLFAIEQPKLCGLHAITPEHGIDAESLAGLFARLTLSDQQLGQGFGKDEHAGLFIDLDQPGQAQARFPAFLTRIADPSKPRSWTLEKARAEWYWGHLATVAGLSTKGVFEDWMWWCASLHLLKPQDDSARTPHWIQVGRPELANRLQEAENWLDGPAPDGYRETVKVLDRVFGSDQIPGKFAPKGAAVPGVQTVEALEYLARAHTLVDTLTTEEETLTEVEMNDTLCRRLPSVVWARLEMLASIDRVRPQETPKIGIDNVRTLGLDDPSRSLYERVAQARLFAERVVSAGGTISDQVNRRIAEIEADPDADPPFPRRLFTLSLETIRNILQGALENATDTDTQKEEDSAGTETLRHFLRALKLDKAAERLDLLARELGVDLRSGHARPFLEVDGHILHAYRQLKDRYKTARDLTAEVSERIGNAQGALEPLPPDYAQVDHPILLEQLLDQLRQVEESFDELEEQVDEQRARMRLQARKGQFSAFRDIPESMVKPIHTSAAVLGGRLQRIENEIQAYRAAKVQAANGGLRRLINPLLKATGQGEIPPVTVEGLTALSLHDMNVELDLWLQQLAGQGEQALAGSVPLERWRAIAEDLLAGREPVMTDSERDGLVKRRILQVRIAFGEGP